MSNNVAQKEVTKRKSKQLVEDAEESNAPIGIFRLVDRQNSGMIRIGTERLPEPDELNVAGFRKIMNTSAFRKKKANGQGFDRVPIKFLASTTEIIISKQKETDVENPEEDSIYFRNGELVVVGEGKTEGLLKFMRLSSYSGTNPDRIPTADVIYIEVFPEEEKEEYNDAIFDHGKAIKFIEDTFITERSAKGTIYDEFRLAAHAKLHNIVADTPAGKIKGLIAVASANPSDFLKRSTAFEETTLTDILHAEKLGLIRFDNTAVTYVGKNKIIMSYSDKLHVDDKRKALGGYFMSAKGSADYKEFIVELNAKKEQSI